MRRGFVIGVLVFGAALATAGVALLNLSGPDAAEAWLLFFAAIALFPPWHAWAQGAPEAPPHDLFRNRDA